MFLIVFLKTSGGSAPDSTSSYPYGSKRSRSLDKKGSRSLDSANDEKDSETSRRLSCAGSVSGTSGGTFAIGKHVFVYSTTFQLHAAVYSIIPKGVKNINLI